MVPRPTRREVLLASAVATLVVVGAVIAAAVTVSGIPAPSYASDAPLVGAFLASRAELPRGWVADQHNLYSRAQLLAQAGQLTPGRQALALDRQCAFLLGPTDAAQVTAVGDDEFDGRAPAGGGPAPELFTEATLYETAAPVAADAAAARRGGFESCVGRLFGSLDSPAGQRSSAKLHPQSLKVPLGRVRAIAVAGSWATSYLAGGPGTGSSLVLSDIRIEIVLLTGSRAEVLVVAENPAGPVPQAVVNAVVTHAARAIEAGLA